MKRLSSIILLCALSLSLFAQQPQDKDPRAKEILDEVASKSKAYKTIKARFSYELENTQEGITDEHKGTIWMKAEKYKIQLMGTERVFDGQDLYTVLDGEVTISKPATDGEENVMSDPQKLFTLYQDGFKYRLVKEYKFSGKPYAEIDLYPMKSADADYSSVKLKINKETMELFSIRYKQKNGINYTIEISRMETDLPLDDSDFTVDLTKYSDDSIIDTRE